MKPLLLFPFLFAVSDRSWLADQFDKVVQARLQTPSEATSKPDPPMYQRGSVSGTIMIPIATGPELGFSRMTVPNSYGTHFQAISHYIRDFVPERENEKELLTQMEDQKMQLGMFLFGQAILDQPDTTMDYRALKGPAIITKGTRRPPQMARLIDPPAHPDPDALPTWLEAYPIGLRAMRSFADGGHGFETRIGDWTIAARPAIATNDRCLGCHNAANTNSKKKLKLGEPVGGILYAYKFT